PARRGVVRDLSFEPDWTPNLSGKTSARPAWVSTPSQTPPPASAHTRPRPPRTRPRRTRPAPRSRATRHSAGVDNRQALTVTRAPGEPVRVGDNHLPTPVYHRHAYRGCPYLNTRAP